MHHAESTVGKQAFIERFAAVLTEAGLPRMPALVSRWEADKPAHQG